MSSKASISKNMFLAKRRPQNSRYQGVRLDLKSYQHSSLPGDYDALELTSSINTRVRYIDPPKAKEKRIWVRNNNPIDGNQQIVIESGGNIALADVATQLYPDQYMGVSWDKARRTWRVIALPFRIDGGMFKYTGEAGFAGLILDSDYNPLKWSDGNYIQWGTINLP
jgi:hypothetical protein